MRVIKHVEHSSGGLYHHGIKGQRWGVRRFQDEDGSLTSQGRKRYNVNADGTARLKDSYRKKETRKGIVKGAIGGVVAGKAASKLVKAPAGKKPIKRSVLAMTIGTVLVTSSAKNFLNANKNKTINTTGQGGTPERNKKK